MRHLSYVLAGFLCCGFSVGEDIIVRGKVKALKSGEKVLFRPEGATTSITVPNRSILNLWTACVLTAIGCGMTFNDGVVTSGGLSGDGASLDVTTPTVSFTAPNDGATVSGSNITVSADAADNVGVVGVQFKLDGSTLQAEDTEAPYTILWDTTIASNASHTLSAVVRDGTGNTATATRSVTVNNAAPPATITFDSASSHISTAAASTMTHFHTIGVNANRLFCEACMLEDTSGSGEMVVTAATFNGAAMTKVFSQDVPLTNSPNRLETWCILAPDSGTGSVIFNFTGQVSFAACAGQSVFNAKQETPYTSMSAFVEGGTTPSVISTSLATTTDGDLVMDFVGSAGAESSSTPDSGQTERVDIAHTPGPGAQIAASTKVVGVAGTQTHQWTSSDNARMGLGVVAIRDVNAVPPADSTPPTVAVTSPINNATVSATITVTASCTDNVACADVQFKLNGANLGSLDTTAPYSTSWNTTTSADGVYTLTAVGRDAIPNSTLSPSVVVTVSNSSTTPTDGPNQPLWGGTEVSRWQALQAANGTAWQRLVAEASKTATQTGPESAINGAWAAMAYRATGDVNYFNLAQSHIDTWLGSYVYDGSHQDALRERFCDIGYIYYFISPGQTSDQRTSLVNHIFAMTQASINTWNNPGAYMPFDTDQLVGSYVGLRLANQAIIDDGRATGGQISTATSFLANGDVAAMKARVEQLIANSNDTWMEGSQYNEGTDGFLMLLAAQVNDVAGLDAYANKRARAALRNLTYDNGDTLPWGTTEFLTNLVLHRRIPLLWQFTSLSGTDGTNARKLIDTLGGTSFAGGNGNRGWLMARPERTGTNYSILGPSSRGQGLFTYHGTNVTFVTQFQPFFNATGPISDHEVHNVGDWYLDRNNAFVVPSPWGYNTGGNEDVSRWSYGNTLLVDGQPSMYESRGILTKDLDGPCYGQGGNTNGNRWQHLYANTPNRWVHNWEEWTFYCPAGASGIDVVVHFTSVYKDAAPSLANLSGVWESKRTSYEQYRQHILAAATPSVDNTNDLVTWTASGGQPVRVVWHLPSAVTIANSGNQVRAVPDSPQSRQFFLYTVDVGGNATETWNGTVLTIARPGEATINCTPNLSNRATTPSSVYDSNGKLQAVENLFMVYGKADGLVCH